MPKYEDNAFVIPLAKHHRKREDEVRSYVPENVEDTTKNSIDLEIESYLTTLHKFPRRLD